MHSFTGHNASVFATGDPFPFTDQPLIDCGDGFTWRCADETMRSWCEDGELTFRVFPRTGGWFDAQADEIDYASASATFPRCHRGMTVLATGLAYPTSLLVEGVDWTLEQKVLVGESLDGVNTTAGETSVTLATPPPEDVSGIRRVLAVLPSAPGAFVGFGALERHASLMRILFDHKGVSYAI